MASQQEPKGRPDPGSPIERPSSEDSAHESQARQSREQLIRPMSRADEEDPLRRGSPLALIRRFSEDIDHLVESFLGSDWSSLEVFETGDRLIVQARLPGLQKDDIIVELRGTELCISAKRWEHEDSGCFERTVPLPKRVSAEAVSAGFDDGVLRIEIDTSRSAARSGRRIDVRSGDGS